MAKISLDFGTGNTVLARFNETLQRAETLEIPGVTTPMRYRLDSDSPEQVVHVAPSLVHYSERETLIGDQVVSRGLTEHGDTLRWMKRGIAQRVTKRKKTVQGHKSPAEAGEDFLRRVLEYASDQISLADDEFTFTAPTEAFEDFQDWLRRLAEKLGIRRLRLLDEPTACVLGYYGAASKDDCFAVFDFGCGTLDVSVVRIDPAVDGDKKAVQLGQAGRDLGGMDLDRWLADDFVRRHALPDHERRDLEALILRQAEETKVSLSDPDMDETVMTVLHDRGRKPKLLRTAYRRSCGECERGRAGTHDGPGEACFGCLLIAQEFLKQARETLERAMENAAIKAGVRRDSLTRLLVTGGTSLVPTVRRFLRDAFDSRAEYQSPFDAVARGACRGVVSPILQHDYSIESYHAERKNYEFQPLLKRGTEYPTARDVKKLWAKGSHDGMTRIGLKIFEVSQMKKLALDDSLVDERGGLRDDTRVETEFRHVCLNSDNPTFIVADPPVSKLRDARRFQCSFWVNGQRMLLVTVVDHLNGKTLLQDHPVVRL